MGSSRPVITLLLSAALGSCVMAESRLFKPDAGPIHDNNESEDAGPDGSPDVVVPTGDPCAENNGGCDTSPMAQCVAREGVVVSCNCTGGYQGDGRGKDGCTDIDECATNNGGCDTSPRATCKNNIGAAPSCMCPEGVSGNGVGADGCQKCDDRYQCETETVTDTSTQLTWQRVLPASYDGCEDASDEDAGVPDPDARCYQRAARWYCDDLSLAGTGWRLPTADELATITPATGIDPVAFPNDPRKEFWTDSTVPASNNYYYYVISSEDGKRASHAEYYELYVRCVRSSDD